MCGNKCVDLTVDRNNCGGCGKKCGSGRVCDAGKIVVWPENDVPCPNTCEHNIFLPACFFLWRGVWASAVCRGGFVALFGLCDSAMLDTSVTKHVPLHGADRPCKGTCYNVDSDPMNVSHGGAD